MSNILHQKRAARVRRKLKKVNLERFRLSVHRSARNISAQIIDDINRKTLISASSIKVEKKGKKKITKVYFDRGRYRYHGRIKTFADALRKGGLTF